MSNMLSRIVSVSVSVNTGAYGTGTSPGMSSAIHMFRNTSPIALDTTVTDLQELRQSFTKTGDAIGRQLYRLTPGLVAMGIGVPPGPTNSPAFRLGKILRMCGMSEQPNDSSSSSLTYKFRSAGFEDGNIDVQLGDVGPSAIVYKLKGVYGTAVMAGSAGQVITVDPTLTGLVSAQPTAAVTVTPALPAAGNISETMKSEGLTITGVTGGPYTPKFKSFSLDFGVSVQEDTDANQATALAGLVITGRTPTLQLTIGMDSSNVANFYSDLGAASPIIHTIAFRHGSAVGKYMAVTAKAQLVNMTVADDVGLRTLQLQYNLASSTADDELAITFS